MIKNKTDLKVYIAADNSWCKYKTPKDKLIAAICNYPTFRLNKYLYFLRKQEYFINTASGNKFKGAMGLYYERRKNRLGEKLGIEIAPNCFGQGLNIYHGNIVINSGVKAGENCSLHGGNCIGNNGFNDTVPTLGNNVDIGYGAIIIGDITIGDNIIIGANSVVNRSFCEPAQTIAGVPAKRIK